jgi:large subunit ribosomal protein L25
VRKDITVAADVRATRGKNEAHRTRRQDKIPAVVYGAYRDPVAITVNPRDILKIVHSSTGYNTIFNLEIDGGENTPVMVVDQQLDPIKGTLLHADFKRIDLSKRIRVEVPVHTQGEAKGIKLQGGLLEIVTRSVDIECLPDDIPERFTVDVTELMIGQSIRASDIPLAGSIRLASAADSVIAHVVALRGEAAATPEEGAAPAAATPEPEVIKKGKKEEEKGAAEEKDKGKKK